MSHHYCTTTCPSKINVTPTNPLVISVSPGCVKLTWGLPPQPSGSSSEWSTLSHSAREHYHVYLPAPTTRTQASNKWEGLHNAALFTRHSSQQQPFCHTQYNKGQALLVNYVMLQPCVTMQMGTYLYFYVSRVVNILLNEQPVVSKAGCCFLRRETEAFSGDRKYERIKCKYMTTVIMRHLGFSV